MMLELTESQKAYLAGFIDGEGSLLLQPHRRKDWKRVYYCPEVDVYNTDPEILSVLREWTGLGSVNAFHNSKKPSHYKIRYTWRITGLKAKMLLNTLLPYLQIKRKQAELLINCSHDGHIRNNRREHEIIHEAIQVLNKGRIG